MKKIFLLLVTGFAITLASAQRNITPGKPEENGLSPERLTRIDQTLNEYVNKGYIPGAVAIIVRNGKIVYEKSFGYSDVENKTPLKNDNIFRIASQSKAITSLAVMMLWEEGKFSLDQPISDFIPEFKNPKVLATFNEKDSSYTTTPAKSEITIRQLITHSSGIDYAGIGSKEMKAIYAKAGVPSGIGNNDMVLGDKMKILGKLPLKHNPGEQWTYGLNNDVLGYFVEILSGMSFDEFLRQRIFKPLGMNDTYFYLPKEKHNRLVSLYEGKDGKLVKAAARVYDKVDPNYPNTEGKYFSGGAGLSSTVEDYAKFLQLFLNKGEYNGVRLLGRKTVELIMTNQLQAPITTRYGLGFGLETADNDYQSVYSLGTFSWGGAFNTHYWADPKEKLIGLIFTNIYNTPHWAIGDRYKTLVYQAIID
ncbi:MAG: beta-lactamase family protein [Bacteroidetes bacterium]|nr:beta-lactamase family protein [Bacteroidota bacterium]